MSDLHDLTGRKFAGWMRVILRPGFGVHHDGTHYEGGPHVLPIRVAVDLIQSNRADPVFDDPPAAIPDVIQNADPTIENRDPLAARRASRPRKK